LSISAQSEVAGLPADQRRDALSVDPAGTLHRQRIDAAIATGDEVEDEAERPKENVGGLIRCGPDCRGGCTGLDLTNVVNLNRIHKSLRTTTSTDDAL
jgi:hypothetical protein